MCGRYTLRTRLNQFLQLYSAKSSFDWEPRYNIAPTQNVAAIRARQEPDPDGSDSEPHRELVLLRWGLIPPWADDLKIGSRMINARAETIAEKRSFKPALKQRRCLIVADGFYEWKTDGKQKQPFYIHMQDGRPFAFAGLWERWKRGEPPIESCTIITTHPNGLMSQLHDRMPVILPEKAAETWLDPDIQEPEFLASLLEPFPDDEMVAYPVSTLVNSAKQESPECVVPLAEA